MHRPRIGIPLTLDDRGRWRAQREYHYIDRSYADAIDRAGGLPLHLPIQADPRALIDQLDGLLLPGGDDFAAETPLPAGIELDLVAPAQLTFDEALYDAARARALPILGICYGMQLMARREGGQLHAHLPTTCPEAAPHRLPAEQSHSIHLEPSSRLAQILGTTRASVNSLHHQALRSPGATLRVVAHSPDGVIEAIEAIEAERATLADGGDAAPAGARSDRADAPERDWRIGVQWHPEKRACAESERLFRAFVQACRPHADGQAVAPGAEPADGSAAARGGPGCA